ncbi:hypothetical protein H5410_023194 [Solanum commersonii]|uniref:Uncharacterized protein n=1 Tax=Solanum commersonii TaxID=4109 RepID=A0A9J5ZG60_SOLCO|nr:hypothetical protein H5410_023194 [Solanum commersonii]
MRLMLMEAEMNRMMIKMEAEMNRMMIKDGDANEQDVGANEANAAVQDGGGNEQNDDQDGGDPMN